MLVRTFLESQVFGDCTFGWRHQANALIEHSRTIDHFRNARLPGLIMVCDSCFTVAFKTAFYVFTGIGPDNSLERFTERSVGLVTDQPRYIYELFVALFE